MSLGEGFNLDKIRALPIANRSAVGTEAALTMDRPDSQDTTGKLRFLDPDRKVVVLASARRKVVMEQK